jgi:glycosyltransferase involved in cell wall biosynthesis
VDKNILVNATSATVGGTLTILNQFIENINYKVDTKYYIFVPVNSKFVSFDNVEFVPVEAKKYMDRIRWDLLGIKKWCKKNNLEPNLIISLQNTSVRYKNIPQVTYLHQPLPYIKEASWNILKKDERKMWFYKHLYKIWINKSIKKNHYIILQTQWMKKAVIESGYSEDKIIISKPTIKSINEESVKCLDKAGKKYMFYPAADYKYKNHNIIIEAIKLIVEKDPKVRQDIKIIFTLDKESNSNKKVMEYGLEDVFLFIGNQKYEDVLSYYKSSDIVLFPSYIETFGLPLIEASAFGKKIIVSDCSYSREILKNYSLVTYVDYDSEMEWQNAIIDNLRGYKEKPMFNVGEDNWNNVFNLINHII